MTTFISRLQNFLTGEGFDAGEADYFNDDDGTTHEANINAVASTGVAQGTDVGKFSPGNPVLRGQMARFLVRYLAVHEAAGNITPLRHGGPTTSHHRRDVKRNTRHGSAQRQARVRE